MNKEIMNRINEIMKQNGSIELSLDKLDQVSGGYNGTSFESNEEIDDFCEIMQIVYDEYGADVAIEFATIYINDPHITDAIRVGGIPSLRSRLHFAFNADLSKASDRYGYGY